MNQKKAQVSTRMLCSSSPLRESTDAMMTNWVKYMVFAMIAYSQWSIVAISLLGNHYLPLWLSTSIAIPGVQREDVVLNVILVGLAVDHRDAKSFLQVASGFLRAPRKIFPSACNRLGTPNASLLGYRWAHASRKRPDTVSSLLQA